MLGKTNKHEISKIDQTQASIFLQKVEEKFDKLEKKYRQAKGYERNSVYQKMRIYKKYLEKEM